MARELIFEWNPCDAPGVHDPAEAATWADFTVRIQGDPDGPRVPTTLNDRHARTEREAVFGPVLPLAEWFADSWYDLFRSPRPRPAPRWASAYNWDRVHKWRFCGGGVAIPNVTVRPASPGMIDLSWERDDTGPSSRHERVLFTTTGRALLGTDAVRRSVYGFLWSVADRLRNLAPDAPRTREFLDSLSVASDPEHEQHRFRSLAAILGEIWWEIDDRGADLLRTVAKAPLNAVQSALLEVARLPALGDMLAAAQSGWTACTNQPAAPKSWASFSERLKETSGPSHSPSFPWEIGWDSARRLRETLSLPDDTPLDDKPVLEDLKMCDESAFQGFIGPRDSLVAWSAGKSPVRFQAMPQASLSSPATRFRGLRDLYPILFGASPREDSATLLSTAIAGHISIANAFAAELVAPIGLLRKRLPGAGAVDDGLVEDLAAEIQAPVPCVFHQIRNHRLASTERCMGFGEFAG